MSTNETQTDLHYQRPGWFTKHVLNKAVSLMTRAGIGVWGARTLEVTGRKSGQLRRNPVNLLTIDGRNYLVAPRGEAEWVRNVRAADGKLTLIIGRRRQTWNATELTDAAKPQILRQYLRRWKAEVGMFFAGVGPDSTDEQLAAIAPRHPVFELRPQDVN